MQPPPERVKSAMKHQVTYGSDVGSRHWGFAGTRSRGLLRLRNQEGQVLYDGALPDIEVLRLEHWDLKKGQVLTHDANWNPVLIQLEGFPQESDNMQDWGRALNRALARCPELFVADTETGILPVFVTENQCDMIKTGFEKMEMFRLVDQFKTQLSFLDNEKKLKDREHRLTNCKYMMRNDTSIGDRGERKKESRLLGLQLLSDLGLDGPLRYLRSLEEDRGQQIHDMTDALLLAVQDQLNCAEADARAQIRELQALIKSIPRKPTVKRGKKKLPLVVIPEANLVDGQVKEGTMEVVTQTPLPKKVKKPVKQVKKKPVKQVEISSSDEETEEVEPLPRPKSTPRKKTVTKKRSRDVIDDDIELMVTASTEKKICTNSIGPILLRDDTM